MPIRDRFATLYPSWRLRKFCLRFALPRIPQHHISTGIVQRFPHGTGHEPCRLLDISCYDEIVFGSKCSTDGKENGLVASKFSYTKKTD